MTKLKIDENFFKQKPLQKATKQIVEDDEKDQKPNHIIHNGVKKQRDHMINMGGKDIADNLYFNVSIDSNFNQSASIPEYNITRDSPLIAKASDYYLSVLRFSIPSYYAPLGSFITRPNFLTTGVYSISMSYKEYYTGQIYLEIDNISNLNNYFNPDPIQLPNDGYIYYLYSYDRMVHSINEALIKACNLVVANSQGDFISFIDYPFIEFDGNSKLFTLWVPSEFLNSNEFPILMYWNEYLWELFGSFPAIRITDNREFSDDGRDYILTIEYTGGNLMYVDDYHRNQDQLLYKVKQEYVTLFNWNPFNRIVLTTSLIPTRNEYVKGSGDSFLKILTDFIPSNEIVEVRSTFQYYSQGQYRLVDLVSDSSIRDFDIQVYWEDKFGNLNTFYLQPNSNINIKIGFFSKELYHGNHMSGYVVV